MQGEHRENIAEDHPRKDQPDPSKEQQPARAHGRKLPGFRHFPPDVSHFWRSLRKYGRSFTFCLTSYYYMLYSALVLPRGLDYGLATASCTYKSCRINTSRPSPCFACF